MQVRGRWSGEVVIFPSPVPPRILMQAERWVARPCPSLEATMPDQVRQVGYCYLTVPSRPGHGARVLAALKDAGVSLTAYSGFPVRGGKAQIDLVSTDMGAIARVARKEKWRLSPAKRGFLIQGDDRLGAVHRHLAKLAAAKVNVTAADAVTAGRGRYGMILWVKPKDYGRAARALGAR
jgi:hypothetical protein